MVPKIAYNTSLSLLFISIVTIGIGFFMEYIQLEVYVGNLILNTGFLLGQVVGLTILFQGATITSSKYWKIIQFFFGIVLIGVLFEALAWPGTTLLLLISSAWIACIYIIRFFTKKERGHLDILKIIWVLTAYICFFLVKQQWIEKEWLFIAHALFWLIIIDFIYLGYKSKHYTKGMVAYVKLSKKVILSRKI